MTEFPTRVEGRWIRPGEPALPASDRGLLLGHGVFETVLVLGGAPFRLGQHLARLDRSARRFSIGLPHSLETEIGLVLEALRPHPRAALRITVTAGDGLGPDAPDDSSSRLILQGRSAGPEPGETVSLVVAGSPVNPDGVTCGHKTLGYLEALEARREARLRGGDEALRTNLRGEVVGGAITNLFLVKGDTLWTPALKTGALPGITRRAVLELAEGEGLRVEEQVFGLGDVEVASELFLTNALKGIAPVTELERQAVGSGKVGPVTRRLLERYLDLVRRETGTGD